MDGATDDADDACRHGVVDSDALDEDMAMRRRVFTNIYNISTTSTHANSEKDASPAACKPFGNMLF